MKKQRLKIKLIFAWYDFWIGIFYDREKKWIYIFIIPMVGIVIKLKEKEKAWNLRPFN